MKDDIYRQILQLLKRLDAAKIAHRLGQGRDDAIMIQVDVPGERWEIEFVDYEDEVHVEIERFHSKGAIEDESALDELFANFSDKEEPVIQNDSSRQ